MNPVNIKQLIESKPPKNGKFYLIAVDGRGGAGKTDFTKYLSKLLPNFTIINGDDYFEHDDSTIAWGSFNEERFYKDVIRPLQKNLTSFSYYPYDWHAEPHISEKKLHIKTGLIIERSFSFAFDLNWDFKIWVETPKNIARDRGIERDGMPKQHSLRQWKEVWQPQEDGHIKTFDPLKTADLIIDGTKPFVNQVI